MPLGGDHSTAGVRIGGTLKARGFAGLIRYAAGGRPDVSITRAEADDLKANGIPLGIVIEHEADWLLRGNVAGRVAAARDVWRAAGVPDGPTYLACDFDVTRGGFTSPGSPGDRNMVGVLAALIAAAGVIGAGNVGFYGSWFACDWLASRAPWIRWYWSTEAWSMGRGPHPRAQLYQQANSVKVAGVDVDIDRILAPNWGQRTGAAPPIKPPTTPEGTIMIVTYVTADHRVGFAVKTDKGEVLHIEQQHPSGVQGLDSDFWRKQDGSADWLSLGHPGQ